jgi:hypothetical protein
MLKIYIIDADNCLSVEADLTPARRTHQRAAGGRPLRAQGSRPGHHAQRDCARSAAWSDRLEQQCRCAARRMT